MHYRSNWRSCADWNAEGLTIKSTTSDTAVKMYDAAISQLVGWGDDPNVGGFGKTLGDMFEADPNFILGRSFALGLEASNVRQNKDLQKQLSELVELANKNRSHITDREYQHVQAVQKSAARDLKGASYIYDQILVEYPTDVHALRFNHDIYYGSGRTNQIRDLIARVMPVWKNSSLPLKNYIHGLYAFGLEESQLYDRAEREGRLALEANPHDGWATHAVSHVMVMNGRLKEGIDFMSSTQSDWEPCNWLACHNFWHWAVFHIEREEYESALQLFDSQIGRRTLESKELFNVVDAASLLYRLDLIKPKQLTTVKNWEDIYSIIEPHLNDHNMGFNDTHILMACLGAGRPKEAQQLIESIDRSVLTETWTRVTIPLMEAMVDYNEERYHKTVETLLKIRYDIKDIGGSDAQRDVFNQLLIVAALKSSNPSHKQLCQRLCAERQALNNSSFINTLLSAK